MSWSEKKDGKMQSEDETQNHSRIQKESLQLSLQMDASQTNQSPLQLPQTSNEDPMCQRKVLPENENEIFLAEAQMHDPT